MWTGRVCASLSLCRAVPTIVPVATIPRPILSPMDIWMKLIIFLHNIRRIPFYRASLFPAGNLFVNRNRWLNWGEEFMTQEVMSLHTPVTYMKTYFRWQRILLPSAISWLSPTSSLMDLTLKPSAISLFLSADAAINES